MMPPGGAPARAQQSATLERLVHDRATADDIGAWLEEIDGDGDGLGEDAVGVGPAVGLSSDRVTATTATTAASPSVRISATTFQPDPRRSGSSGSVTRPPATSAGR